MTNYQESRHGMTNETYYLPDNYNRDGLLQFFYFRNIHNEYLIFEQRVNEEFCKDKLLVYHSQMEI